MPGRPNYGKLARTHSRQLDLGVGMVKQPTEHSSEFQMSNEDFPALPGAPARWVVGLQIIKLAPPHSSMILILNVFLLSVILRLFLIILVIPVGGLAVF